MIEEWMNLGFPGQTGQYSHIILVDPKCQLAFVTSAPQTQRGFPVDIVRNTNLLTYLLTYIWRF